MNHEREQILKTADRLRGDLVVTLRELDRRRGAALDVRGQLASHRPLLIGLGAGACVALSGTVVYLVLHARARRRNLPRLRLRGAVRAWHHPERLAARAAFRPAPVEVARKVMLAFMTALVAQLAKRAAVGLVPSDIRGRVRT